MGELISLRHIGSWARETFWLLPAVCVVVAIVLGVLVPEVHLPAGALLFAGGPESARSILSSITSAMITMTGLVFSVTIVALQLAAGQFSSRVMRDFLSDRVIQVTFGTFVATFTYTIIIQRSVRGITGGRDPVVPQLGMTVAFVLVMVSIALFVVYINRIANSIRIANIVARIGARTRATIEVRYPVQEPPDQSSAPVGPPHRYVTAHRPGVIVSINEQALVALSARSRSVLVLVPRLGDYVPAGARVFGVYGDHPGDDALLRHVAFDTERTYEQDVAFGFRELVDIAERALSPAVNDPTTAAQAIDVLHDLLRRLGQRPPPSGHHLDRAGRLRLLAHRYTFGDLLDLAMEEIAHYGAHDIQAPRRLQAVLIDLQGCALPQYQPAIARWRSALGTSPDETRGRHGQGTTWQQPST
ncbi:MAG: DUF2254 domain-containing protein [Actinomycetota bacterium]|nr:DUF2254 domain-containing protein [Actinomycetota bacterium]